MAELTDIERERAIKHFEALRLDIRDEIKCRIDQRDRFSIQLTLALGAIVGFSLSSDEVRSTVLVAPLVAIYFTFLIQYSYRIHSTLAQYLREVVEPRLGALCSVDPDEEWERWYVGKRASKSTTGGKRYRPGIRRTFFLYALWVVVLIPGLVARYLPGDPDLEPVAWMLTLAYAFFSFLIWFEFRGD